MLSILKPKNADPAGKDRVASAYGKKQVVLNLIFLLVVACIVYLVTGQPFCPQSILVAAVVNAVYVAVSHRIFTAAHQRGMALIKQKDFEAARREFERSYDYFSRVPMLDEFRGLLFGSGSAMSFREMALVNIGFCYVQLGKSDQARVAYQKALDEFPQSTLARQGLGFLKE